MEALKQEDGARFFEFGPFLVDGIKCVLLREGKIVPLNLKAFEILMVLIRNHSQVLEKDELFRQVWPDTVVEENNLARNISALRKALDEHPNEHQYILTVPGRGYRFVADVKEIDEGQGHTSVLSVRRGNGDLLVVSNGNHLSADAAVTTVETPVEPPLPRAAQPRTVRVAGMSLALLIVAFTVIALAAYFVPRSARTDTVAPQHNLWQLTFDPGLQSEPTWSPDGRFIAYSSDKSGNFDIWVQPVGEGNAVRVTNSTAHDWQPDWAPEGNRLVFRSEREGGGLYVVPALGGNERKVSNFGYRPRWSPDGSQILFYSSMLSNNTVEIPRVCVVGLDGNPPRDVLSVFLAEFDSVRVAWHPDGRRLSVWGNHREKGWSFWTVPLPDGTPVRSEMTAKVQDQLRETSVGLTDFLWSSSGHELYFEGVSRGVRNIWKVEIDPKSLRWISGPERITTGTGLETDLAISPDGKKLAFTQRAEHTRLWSLPFDGLAGKIKSTGQPVTPAGIDASSPDISLDGQKLLYTAQRAGKWELWEKSLRDGRETGLSFDGSRMRLRWSPDGSRLAFTRIRLGDHEQTKSERAVVVLSADGREEQIVTTPSEHGASVWDWSADGKWILGGCMGDGPGRRTLCMFPVAAAPHAETEMRGITSNPEKNIYQARFSPNSRWISFCAARNNAAGISTIYIISASGSEWVPITEGKYFDDKPRWSSDGRVLYFVSNRTGFFNVWGIRFDPEAGRPVGEPFRVTSFENPSQMILSDVRAMEMALSTDRLILPIMEVSGGIWILENVGH